MDTVLLTGATGFVGSHLQPVLAAAGFGVRCATRDPRRARARRPELECVHLDLNQRATMGPALAGCRSAIYLVHAMSQGPGYAEREYESARAFADEAAAAGLDRIVYLGAVVPQGRPSPHLRSRIATGEVLRAGKVPVFELRAAMIIGYGSISWHIVRDLAARLPAMILPRCLANRSQPIGIDDVVYAIERALNLPVKDAGVYALPGPEILSGKDILLRIARLRGMRPFTLSVPVLTPHLSSYWLKFVTGADYGVARELVDGLSSDLLSRGRVFWDLVPEHELLSFDKAAQRALAKEGGGELGSVNLVERAAGWAARAPL